MFKSVQGRAFPRPSCECSNIPCTASVGQEPEGHGATPDGDVAWKSCQFGRPIGPNPHTGRSTHCGEFLKAPTSLLGAAMCRWTAGACGSKLREKKGRCGHGNIRKLEDPIETDSRCCKAPKCSPNLEPHIAMILVAEGAPNAAIRRAFLRWDATNHLKDLLGFRFNGWYRTCPQIYIYE